MRLSTDWRLRALLSACAWVAMVTLCSLDAEAAEPWTADDTHAALNGASPTVVCIVARESNFEPYALGALGEQGAIQLLPSWRGGGQWSDFHYGDWTPLPPEYRSTWNPYQSVAYLEHWGASHDWTFGPWSTWRLCR